MKIGIDARLYNQTGVGRYIRNLIQVLGEIDKENYYVVFLRKEDKAFFQLPNNRWQIRIVDVRWHSFSEQLIMPLVLSWENLDLVHFPYFNVPILYHRPFVVTIHDLTHLYFNTGRASTLPKIFYQIKRLGLKIALWWAINKSKKIIAVSCTTKNEILKNYRINPEKIAVTYEGINKTQNLGLRARDENLKFKINKAYVLYVGNAYPHKNLERLISAFKELIFNNQQFNSLKLVLVGPNDFFYQKLRNFVKEKNLADKVIFYGPAKEEELNVLYKQALGFVLPSLMEGFGLVGLEAMSQGCPVIASDIPSLKEIYSQAAWFFNAQKTNDIQEKIKKIIDFKDLRNDLIKKGKERVKIFSWQQMGKKTLEVYREVIK